MSNKIDLDQAQNRIGNYWSECYTTTQFAASLDECRTLLAYARELEAENERLKSPDGARVVSIGGEMLTGSEIYTRCLGEVRIRHALEASLAEAREVLADAKRCANYWWFNRPADLKTQKITDYPAPEPCGTCKGRGIEFHPTASSYDTPADAAKWQFTPEYRGWCRECPDCGEGEA